MKRSLIPLLGCVSLWTLTSVPGAEQVPAKAAPTELKTTRDQASYAIGQNIGRSIKNDGLDLNTAALIEGLMDVLGGKPSKLSDQQLQAAMETFRREVETKMADKARAEGEKNKKEGTAFLAVNKGKQGVVTLPSGLQYVILKSGKGGVSPKVTDRVKAHYHGTFIDGKVFDSSVERGEPLTMAVGELIRGWGEALQKMKVGDKWKLFVPSELAYGSRADIPGIAPNSVLIFEIELLGIEPQQ